MPCRTLKVHVPGMVEAFKGVFLRWAFFWIHLTKHIFELLIIMDDIHI